MTVLTREERDRDGKNLRRENAFVVRPSKDLSLKYLANFSLDASREYSDVQRGITSIYE